MKLLEESARGRLGKMLTSRLLVSVFKITVENINCLKKWICMGFNVFSLCIQGLPSWILLRRSTTTGSNPKPPFFMKHVIVRDNLRAACKIASFYFLFWPFSFLYFIINTSSKGAAKKIAVLPSHVGGVHRQAKEGITRQAWHLKPITCCSP